MKLTRRDFLKLAAASTPALFMPKAFNNNAQEASGKPNIIIIVFDAMSAKNLSLYGYPRPTTPNLERFAERATVYHNHYSGGNYTIPGVASLLTGTYPWTNRAINHGGFVKQNLVENNLFRVLGSDYHRWGFSQSIWANMILTQFKDDMDVIFPPETFSETDYLISHYFPNDEQMAIRALDDFVFKMEYSPASMVFAPLQRYLYYRDSVKLSSENYPRGLPHNVNYPLYFRLDRVFEGLQSLFPKVVSPYATYIHIFAPHFPYRATDKFYGKFVDGYNPDDKPEHRFSDHTPKQTLKTARRSYDEYIASLDDEFGKFLDSLETQGVFENSYVIVTSDHGEMFERGEKAHSTPLLYDPVINVPLLISAPSQTTRKNIFAPTNAVDILPTVMHLTGQAIPPWAEGFVLPGMGGEENVNRSSFVVEAKKSSAFLPLSKATVALRKDNFKLIYYTGLEEDDSFELYDIGADPEEMKDLISSSPTVFKAMKDELLQAFDAANKPYKV